MTIYYIGNEKKYNALKNKFEKENISLKCYDNDVNPLDVEYALVWNQSESTFEKMKNLRWVSSLGAGVDHLINDINLGKDVIITSIKDEYLPLDMARYAAACILQEQKRFRQYRQLQDSKSWDFVKEPKIKRVLILGLGNIGQKISSVLQGLGYEINGLSNSTKKISGVKNFTKGLYDPEMYEDIQVVINVLPLTNETYHALNEQFFKLLPPNTHVVNMGRGDQMPGDDLLQYLKKNPNAIAYMDVFENEPLPKNHPFWSHPQVMVTPHIAAISRISSVVKQVSKNFHLLKAQKEEQMIGVVDRSKGY
ncbi:MAG: hypothetical protein LAT68_15115 [Cyclobacteriaceae bacterium]|nr:hypothetical protein [Cyclobacteriaceae bacterium]MCH8517651.1 hypothetical protein [Cyclobacteriaceae bacterium]